MSMQYSLKINTDNWREIKNAVDKFLETDFDYQQALNDAARKQTAREDALVNLNILVRNNPPH